MKSYLFAAAAAAVIASPAAARDGSGYAGIQAGVFIPQKSDVHRIGPPVTIDRVGDSAYHLRDWDTLAWQGIAGFRVPVSANLDAGLKYRYFSAGTLRGDLFAHSFDARSFVHSHSVLASLTYNFGAAEALP